MARPRKSNAVKVLSGEKRPSRLNRKEPHFKPGIPDCPEIILNNPVARERWDYETKLLNEAGILCPLDQASLVARCLLYANILELQGILDREGRLTPSGKAHPAASMLTTALKEFRAFGSLLGCDAASRLKAQVLTDNSEKNEFDEFKARHGR